MWVSPAQNFLKPPPVPDTPTVILTLPSVAMPNSSAIASVIGKTVLDPSTLMSPESSESIAGAVVNAGAAPPDGAVVAAGAAVVAAGAVPPDTTVVAAGADVAVGSPPPHAVTASANRPAASRNARVRMCKGT